MYKLLRAIFLSIQIIGGLLAVSAQAVEPDEMLANPVLEARARALSAELRCLVCQNQSIDDSNAPLARDLRLLVRERLTAGDRDAQILDYVVARYGAFVLLRPRLEGATLALWLAPLLVLIGGGWLCYLVMRQPAAGLNDGAKLSSDEQRRLDAILAEGGDRTERHGPDVRAP